MTTKADFKPALAFHVLTPFYEMVVKPLMHKRWICIAQEAAHLCPQDGSVIDLGCGPGTLLRYLHATRPDIHLKGQDIDPKIIEVALSKDKTKCIEFDATSIDQTGMPDESMDVVLSTLMFHHLDHETQRRAFREIKRILKPTGSFLLFDFSIPEGPQPLLSAKWWSWIEPEIKVQLKGRLLELGRETGAKQHTLWTTRGCISLHLFSFAPKNS